MGAGAACTPGIQGQRVFDQLKPPPLRHLLLTFFNGRIEKFLDATAGQAHQVIVVLALIELKYRLTRFEVASQQQAGLLKLHEYPIDSGQADVGSLGDQGFVHVFRAEVPALGLPEQGQYLEPGHRGFQSAALEFVSCVHAPPQKPLGPVTRPDEGAARMDRMISMKTTSAAAWRWRLWLLLAPAMSTWVGCAAPQNATDSFMGWITPYRIDIVQGNAVTSEQVQRVRPGMTRAQVRDILGSPMLTDAFHADRWDYIFLKRRPGDEPVRRHVSVFFQGDVLAKLESPSDLPDENRFVATIVPAPKDLKRAPLELTDAQRQALPKPAGRPAAPPERAGAVRTYPPLESP